MSPLISYLDLAAERGRQQIERATAREERVSETVGTGGSEPGGLEALVARLVEPDLHEHFTGSDRVLEEKTLLALREGLADVGYGKVPIDVIDGRRGIELRLCLGANLSGALKRFRVVVVVELGEDVEDGVLSLCPLRQTVDTVERRTLEVLQAIRPAVVNRKSWGGNRSWWGPRSQAVAMSVIRTARQQGVDPIELMATAQCEREPTPA